MTSPPPPQPYLTSPYLVRLSYSSYASIACSDDDGSALRASREYKGFLTGAVEVEQVVEGRRKGVRTR